MGEFTSITPIRGLNVPNPVSTVRLVIDQFGEYTILSISAMPIDGLGTFKQPKVPELHERMIAAEALARDTP